MCRAGALPAPGGADFRMRNTVYIHVYPGEDTSGVIYQATSEPKTPARATFSDKLASGVASLSKVMAFLAVFVLFVAYAPSIWYQVTAGEGLNRVSSLLLETAEESDYKVERSLEFEKKDSYEPRFDATLPEENTIRIPSIGVYGEVYEAPYEDFEVALRKGVWRAPDFSTPKDQSKPTILAAHRYGYLFWSNLYRRQNSFYNLPELKEGDVVEIYWKQRKYVYEIYASEEGEEITDYSADLILYTCENLTSPVRIFKYARLLKI